MCGRFIVEFTADDLYALMRNIRVNEPSHSGFPVKQGIITPGMYTPILRATAHSIQTTEMLWGIPVSIMDKETRKPSGKFGAGINAKQENLNFIPEWRSIKHNPIIIPTSGFFEPHKKAGQKPPYDQYMFRQKNSDFVFLAGLCKENSEILRFTVLTTKPNKSVSSIHPRMPIILNQEEIVPWLFQTDPDYFLKRTQPPLYSYRCDTKTGKPISKH